MHASVITSKFPVFLGDNILFLFISPRITNFPKQFFGLPYIWIGTRQYELLENFEKSSAFLLLSVNYFDVALIRIWPRIALKRLCNINSIFKERIWIWMQSLIEEEFSLWNISIFPETLGLNTLHMNLQKLLLHEIGGKAFRREFFIRTLLGNIYWQWIFNFY